MTEPGKKYLMKRRRYGYGWIPTSWQGWAVVASHLGVITVAATALPAKPAQPTTGELTRFFVIVGLSVTSLVLTSAQMGPSPKWRWGSKPTDNPDEDF